MTYIYFATSTIYNRSLSQYNCHFTLAIMSAQSLTCSFGSNDSQCGPFANNSAIIPLEKCDHDMTSYLVNLGVSVKRSKDEHALSEIKLILNRAGRVEESAEVATMTICPKHRRELTLDWSGRKRRTCCHPLHKGLQKQMANFRRVNASMSDEILSLHKLAVPIGSGEFISTICSYRNTELGLDKWGKCE